MALVGLAEGGRGAELNGGENSLHWKAKMLPLFNIMTLWFRQFFFFLIYRLLLLVLLVNGRINVMCYLILPSNQEIILVYNLCSVFGKV